MGAILSLLSPNLAEWAVSRNSNSEIPATHRIVPNQL